MSDYHFPIPGSSEESKIRVFARRHWASYLGQFLLSVFLMVIPIFVIAGIISSNQAYLQGIVAHFLVIGFSIYYLIIINFAFVAWITFYYDVYIVCDDEIIDIMQVGYFGRTINRISLLRVQDVSSKMKGFFPTLFGFGDVLVETAGEKSQNYVLEGLPNPQEVASRVMELHNDLIEREGLHKHILEAEGALTPGTIRKHLSEHEHPEYPKAKSTYQELLEKERNSGGQGSNQGGQSAPPAPPANSEWNRPESETMESENSESQKPEPAEESTEPSQPESTPEEDRNIHYPAETPEEQPAEPAQPEENNYPKQNSNGEGEISRDELNKGGEIDLK